MPNNNKESKEQILKMLHDLREDMVQNRKDIERLTKSIAKGQEPRQSTIQKYTRRATGIIKRLLKAFYTHPIAFSLVFLIHRTVPKEKQLAYYIAVALVPLVQLVLKIGKFTIAVVVFLSAYRLLTFDINKVVSLSWETMALARAAAASAQEAKTGLQIGL